MRSLRMKMVMIMVILILALMLTTDERRRQFLCVPVL